MALRLSPIDRPRNPLLRFAYWVAKRQFGKVLSPIRVIYARKLRLMPIAAQIQHTMENGLSFESSLRLLIQVQTSRLNGCLFCEDLALANALREQVGPQRFAAVEDFRTSALFTERERAALAFTEALVRNRHIEDEVFGEAQAHFSERELVELAWIAAAETYFNIQAHAFGIGSDELVALASAKVRAAEPGASNG